MIALQSARFLHREYVNVTFVNRVLHAGYFTLTSRVIEDLLLVCLRTIVMQIGSLAG